MDPQTRNILEKVDSILEELDFLRYRIVDFGLELTEEQADALDEAKRVLRRARLNL